MKEFDDLNLDSEIKKGIAVVDFYATWCFPCKALGPTLDKAAANFTNDEGVKFGKVNVDENPEVTKKYKISSLPTILFFKDGEVVDKISGLTSETKIVETVKKL